MRMDISVRRLLGDADVWMKLELFQCTGSFKARGTLTAVRLVLASANPARMALARSYGAELLVAPDGATAFAMDVTLVRDEQRTFIHPFEGVSSSLGTTTVGLEFAEQLPGLVAALAAVGRCCMASGVPAAVRKLQPNCRVIGVEPEDNDVMRCSFAAGSPQGQEKSPTIADSLARL